jgi:hypothetical protein
MRAHGFRTHVLLALAGAVVMLASLGRPWYARAPQPQHAGPVPIGDLNGPLAGLVHGARRWVTDTHGVTGWHALGTTGHVLAALVALCILATLGNVAASTQLLAREPLRYAAPAVLALTLWRLVDPPGDNGIWELRSGALLAAVGALVLATCARDVVRAPHRRHVAVAGYVPPAPAEAGGPAVPPGA